MTIAKPLYSNLRDLSFQFFKWLESNEEVPSISCTQVLLSSSCGRIC
jgi:hypothetical protein